METTGLQPAVLTLPRMSRLLGTTQRWLREQADVGTIPALRTGKRRYLFNVEATTQAVAEMAKARVRTSV